VDYMGKNVPPSDLFGFGMVVIQVQNSGFPGLNLLWLVMSL